MITKFAEGAILRTLRRRVVLLVFANKADSVKSATPKGVKQKIKLTTLRGWEDYTDTRKNVEFEEDDIPTLYLAERYYTASLRS